MATYGTCQDMDDLPERLRHTFVVSSDITAEEHVRMQAAIQAFVDNSICKTCNFPEGATEEDVAKAYMLAWETGLQGADRLCHRQPPEGGAGDQGDARQEGRAGAAAEAAAVHTNGARLCGMPTACVNGTQRLSCEVEVDVAS